jgi:hypothetical protein
MSFAHGSAVDAITVLLVNSAGAVVAIPHTVDDLELTVYGSAHLDPGLTEGSVASFVSDELAEQGQLSNTRVTAMSLLVSPIGQLAQVGGEMYMARTNARNIVRDVSITDLMTTISQNNDPNMWINTPVSRGGYGWWMPDDASSYEPRPYGSFEESDNVLVAAGRMEPGNSLRIHASYIVEFYTPKQVFEKEYGPPLAGAYEAAFNQLLQAPAVCQNEDHEALIAKIKRGLRSALSAIDSATTWASQNRAAIMAATSAATALL